MSTDTTQTPTPQVGATTQTGAIKPKRTSTVAAVAAGAGVALALSGLAGMATATPGHDAVGRTEAIGRFGTPTDVQFRFPLGNGRHVVNVHGAQQTMMQRITVQAGGHTGWHTHPGPAVAIVQEGSLTLYQADDPTCTGSEYSGTVNTFIDPGQGNVHLARNEGDVPAVIWVTYFDVPEGGSPRTDAADPGYCTF